MLKKLNILLVTSMIGLSVLSCNNNDQQVKEGSNIGIMSAMDVELDFLVSKLENKQDISVGGNTYYKGVLNGKNVILVHSGIGKSLSAAVTSTLIEKFKVSSIIFTGVAGGVDDRVKITDVVISTRVMFHDYGHYENTGKMVLGKYPLEKIELDADKSLVEKAYKTAIDIRGKEHVYKGLIATGDQFMENAKYVDYLSEEFGALAVDMEGASVGYIASRVGVPFVIIRSMSDKADGLAHEDFQNWYKIVSDNSAKIVLELIKKL